MSKILLTLCTVHVGKRVLLGMKKRGFGQGRWNGFGGKVHKNESIEVAARRELQEEASIVATEIHQLGVLQFEFQNNPDILETHVFKCQKYTGTIQESDEMRPQWFDIENMPFDQMWPDDIYWMPLFLQDKKFKGKFLFDENNAVVDSKLQEVSTL